MINLLYCGQFYDFSGYGIASREYVKSIDIANKDNRINLKIYPVIASKANNIDTETIATIDKYLFNSDEEIDKFISEGYYCIWHMPPVMGITSDDNFQTNSKHSKRLRELILKSKKNISYLAWETDKLPETYGQVLKYFNCKDVWVPSLFNKRIIENYDNSINCQILSHVVDIKQIKKLKNIEIPFEFKDKYVVLSSSQWTERKGFDILLKSFLTEFYYDEDAVLIVKTIESSTHNQKDISNEIMKIKNVISFGKNDFKCKVILLLGYYTEEEINWLYEKATIVASLTRGEGFGLTLAESACRGKPVLCPADGGHIDFLSDTGAYFCEGHWDNCMLGIEPYEFNSNWFETHIFSAREKLRESYKDWKFDKDKYEQKCINSKNFIESKNIGYFDIGNDIIKKLNKLSPKIQKTKSNILKYEISKQKTTKEKLDILHNSYNGEDCYILNCGPSLNEYTKDYLDNLLKDKLVFSVKQAYDRHPQITDFHFFNCCNLPIADNKIEHYSYTDDKDPIVIGSSNYPEGMRWSRYQKYDLFLNVQNRANIEKEFLCFTKDFDSHILEKQVQRPCGPGIMLETIMYTAVHLGVKNIFALGWDLSYDNLKDVEKYKHFFGETKNLFNRGDMLDWEIQATRDVSKDLYYWLKSKGINLNIVSTQSSLYKGIPRVKL